MPYYLSHYVEVVGPDGDVRAIPRGSEQSGWAAIDLRPDGGATLGGGGLNACLLYLPAHDPHPLMNRFGDYADEAVSEVTKQNILSRIGLVDATISTVAELVEEIMIKPPANGWLQPRMTHRRYIEIILGPVRRVVPLLAGGAIITESFNKADNGLGPDLSWTNPMRGTALNISTNRAHGADTEGEARADRDLWTDNHYAKAVIGPGSSFASDIRHGVLCRKDSSATVTFYRWAFFGGAVWELVKFVAGAETILHNSYTTAPSNGDGIKISADGSIISGFHPDTLIQATVTDTAIRGNLRCAIMLRSVISSSQHVYFDSFEAGDLVRSVRTLSPLALDMQGEDEGHFNELDVRNWYRRMLPA